MVEREAYCKCGSYLKLKEPFDVAVYVIGQFWQHHSGKKCGLGTTSIIYTKALGEEMVKHLKKKRGKKT